MALLKGASRRAHRAAPRPAERASGRSSTPSPCRSPTWSAASSSSRRSSTIPASPSSWSTRVATRDLPLIQTCAMIFCLGYLALITAADIVAILSNPRLRTDDAPGASRRPAASATASALVGVVGRSRSSCSGPSSPSSAPGSPPIRRARSSTSTTSARSAGQFWLGTDYLGRDMLSRILAGARYTVGISLAAVVLACASGVVLGMTGGGRSAAGSTPCSAACSTR